MGRLDGKVALITGGARGQGAVEAQMMAQEGAKIIIGDILDQQGQQLAAELTQAGLPVTYTHLDVTSEADWQQAIAAAITTYGHLDTLVNNAGILIRKSIEDTTEQDWTRIMDINAKGVFLGSKAAIPPMRQAGGGSIINISSTAGLIGSPDGSPSYTATKGAVRLLTKSTAIQYAPDNIRCNSIHPGPIDTEMIRDTITDPQRWQARMQRLPLKRIGTPQDIAYGVIYLASNESSFVTGSELVIDGGTTAE